MQILQIQIGLQSRMVIVVACLVLYIVCPDYSPASLAEEKKRKVEKYLELFQVKQAWPILAEFSKKIQA